MNNIHLYIGNIEVEFDAAPEILYTYQVDELTNPTIVKNSFSKTITIKGSKSNNNLFGHYWNVERVQVGGTSNASSVYFNASKKMAFSLYVGTELYESGYVKLDEVRRVNGDYEYDITLYGGLGDFFYNLSINNDGNEMKLSDLNFKDDIDFTINLDTVKTAWDSLKNNRQNKWQTINFMPAYNGIPEDFDADKMLIDTKSTNLTKAKTEDGKTYKTKEDWVLAELPDEMTEWETRDLRSYLQRPCIRMKEIVNACCDPDNNGGYEVELDSDFFNENNPYWEETWLTLPMIQTLEYDSGEQPLENSRLMLGKIDGDAHKHINQELVFEMGEFPQSVVSSLTVKGKINVKTSGTYTSFMWFWNRNGDSYHTGYACFGSLFCQLVAKNGSTVVGASNAYNLTSPIRHNGKLYYGHNDRYESDHKFNPYMGKPIYDILGSFGSDGFRKEDASSAYEFSFTISGLTTNVTSLEMVYFWGCSKDKRKKNDIDCLFNKTKDSGWMTMDYSSRYNFDFSDYVFNISSSTLKAVMGGTIGRTGTEVSKQLILNTEASPADYLLSYCKMFGLYFSKSLYENKITIQTRKSFYDREKIVDISGDVDYSQGVTITPIAFNAKWVQFSQEQDETQYINEYNTTKGIVYGSKVLNTGYEFDAEKKELLEGNVIRSAIEGLEKSRYFTCYNNDNKVRPFFGYGMKYNLYNGTDTIEVVGNNAAGSNLLGINENDKLKYYDLFPKLQFHSADNKPTEGNNVLVFFSGFKNLTTGRANPINYFLSDDGYWQSELNDGTPCWLFVSGDKDINGTPIARKVTEIPVFERYLTDSDGTTIKKSLDFGTPQELFIPKYGIKEEVNIYHNFWKTYLEDLYDINTKILTVYVRLKGKVGYDLLRQFYWFENAVWRINKITDWNIGLEDVTKVEFVKVQDLTGYTSITQTRSNTIKLYSSKYFIVPNGERVTLSLLTENGGNWTIVTNNRDLVLSSEKGMGDKEITLTIPQTKSPTTQTYYSVTAIDDEGNTATINLTQNYVGSTQFKLTPSTLIVPSSGGNYDIDFQWINQGENDVKRGTLSGDVKGNVEIDGFSAEVSVNESNEKDTIISGKVLFEAGEYDGEVLIDQMPEMLEFGKDGGEYEFVFNYNTDVRYNYLPYWATVEGNKLTVIPNYYETERGASIMVQNDHSFAYIRLVQEVGKAPAQEIQKVSPNNLYFSAEGCLQYINIQIPNTWRMEKTGSWFSTNISNGDGGSIVSVSCPTNSGNTLNGLIKVIDTVTGDEYLISLTQTGQQIVKQISVEPTTINAPYSGGSYELTFTYANRNGDYVQLEGEGLTWTDLKWNGDIATVNVIVAPNHTYGVKEYTLYFKTPIGEVSVDITQDSFNPYLNLDKSSFSFDSEGGSRQATIETNITWFSTTSDSWLRLVPTDGASGTTVLRVVADENPTLQNRVGYIYITAKETNEKMATITVSQTKFIETITVSPSTITFEAGGGTASFTITSNTSWTIELE